MILISGKLLTERRGANMLWNAYANEPGQLPAISVISAGHIFASRGRRIHRPEGRRDWLLFYVAKGSETFELQTLTVADSGSFIIFRPGEAQLHSSIEYEKSEFYYIHFNLSEDLSAFGLETNKVYRSSSGASVCEAFEEIILELQMKLKLYSVTTAAKLVSLLCTLKRNSVTSHFSTSDEQGKIAFAVQYINRNFRDPLTLSDYAKSVGMSKFHFLRKFREVTGTSPIAYRNNLRLSLAKEMLRDESLSIGEIAEAAGYSALSCFTDAFKQDTGVSPTEYRKTLMASVEESQPKVK